MDILCLCRPPPFSHPLNIIHSRLFSLLKMPPLLFPPLPPFLHHRPHQSHPSAAAPAVAHSLPHTHGCWHQQQAGDCIVALVALHHDFVNIQWTRPSLHSRIQHHRVVEGEER